MPDGNQEYTQAPVPMVQIDDERVRKVSSVVHLQDVLLVHATWDSSIAYRRPDVNTASMRYVFRLAEATWGLHAHGNLEIHLEFRLNALAKGNGDKHDTEVPLFETTSGWAVIFGVPDEFVPADGETMADFTVANGQLNAFPYVRQWVQDITGRAGWPPLVLPTFRIPAKRLERHGRTMISHTKDAAG